MEEGVVFAECRDACLREEFIHGELQVASTVPLVGVEQEHRVACHHQDEMRAMLFRQKEDSIYRLVDDGRRDMSLFVFRQCEEFAPLTGIVLLVADDNRGSLSIFHHIILLFEQSGWFLLIGLDEMLHLHHEHRGLAVAGKDVAHGNHGMVVLVDGDELLVGAGCIVAQDIEQQGMEVVGMLDGILDTRMGVKDVVLVLLVLATKFYVWLAQLRHLVGVQA